MGILKKYYYITIHSLKTDKKILIISILLGFLTTALIGLFVTKTYSNTVQSSIAEKVIRFHVLANSDSELDQKLKLKVRDKVLEKMEPKLSSCINIEDSKTVIEASKDEIKSVALDVIKAEGYNYDVNVFLSTDLFPMKKYGDIVFPSGFYNALRIEIGNADGRNWWCVMFPPLCYVDGSSEKISNESKKNLKNILTEEEYNIIVNSEKDSIPKVKFKIIEWWQEKETGKMEYVTKP